VQKFITAADSDDSPQMKTPGFLPGVFFEPKIISSGRNFSGESTGLSVR
jgi:hypothetical protein